MAQTVQTLMTTDPITLPADAHVREAAQRMRNYDIGDVLVVDGEQLRGIVTDRDLVVRALADRDDPANSALGDVCSADVVSVSPGDDVNDAVSQMRRAGFRRIPVVDDGRVAGVLSLGDAAQAVDPDSALGEISAAPANT